MVIIRQLDCCMITIYLVQYQCYVCRSPLAKHIVRCPCAETCTLPMARVHYHNYLIVAPLHYGFGMCFLSNDDCCNGIFLSNFMSFDTIHCGHFNIFCWIAAWHENCAAARSAGNFNFSLTFFLISCLNSSQPFQSTKHRFTHPMCATSWYSPICSHLIYIWLCVFTVDWHNLHAFNYHYFIWFLSNIVSWKCHSIGPRHAFDKRVH